MPPYSRAPRIRYYLESYKRQLMWGAGAVVVLAAVCSLYVQWERYQESHPAERPLTEEERMNILVAASESSTTTMTVRERHNILEATSASADADASAREGAMSEDEKLRVLQSLQTN